MSLSPGTRLGPYEIVSPLGAGGMGEVYCARDTRLDRDLAIKVLPANLASDPSFRQRMEREAKAISKLSHPHICTLHDIGHQGGVDFLVMELIEGETLAHRLIKGPLPPEQTIRIAAQIADALAHAHKRGITHRDLKPSNIMLTKSGAKLMDFGLAKESGLARAAAAVSEMTAEQSKLTAEGAIVGTFEYMAPEQLEGREADARTDIFALGEVIYEMATGKPAFGGTSRASLIAAILTSEPPSMAALQSMTPSALERVVKKCLAKDPEGRWQSASDLASELSWIADMNSATAAAELGGPRREWLPWAVTAVVLIAAIMTVLAWRAHQPELRRTYAAVLPPENAAIRFAGNYGAPPALSPDGTLLVFGAGPTLWVRSLVDGNLRLLAGTDGAAFPFWSPDSRRIGFFADGKLKTVDAGGGAPISVCDAPNPRGGTWSRNGVILFAPNTRTGLFQVPAGGGTPKPLTEVDASRYTTHRWPYFLPDGKHFIYFAGNHSNPTSEQAGVYLASLDGKETRLLVHSLSGAVYSSGYLLFLQQNALTAQPLNLRALALEGEAVRLADHVVLDLAVWRGMFTSSTTGMLAYASGLYLSGTRLTWYDRHGKELGNLLEKSTYYSPRISHDGKRITFALGDPNADVWMYDDRSKAATRFSFNATVNSEAIWSPDDRYVAYLSNTAASRGIVYTKSSNGSASATALGSAEDQFFAPTDWSPDGRSLVLDKGNPSSTRVWIMPAQGGDPGTAFSPTGVVAYGGRFSPNGRWVAYTSHETGRGEVYVAAFPGPGGRWQISNSGGRFPMWGHDGREIFFFAPDDMLMAAEVDSSGATFELRAIRPLFRTNAALGLRINMSNADVAPDGRILVNTATTETSSPLTLVVNWNAGLK
ncbi:MAG TPA: protein kinase [Terriglobales bacterium]